MVDYLKIKLKNQNGVNVIIGSQKYFDNAYLSCEIMNPDVISNDIVKSSIEDSIVIKNFDLLAKSIYYLYNSTDPITASQIEKFRNCTFKFLIIQILKRLPFLSEFKITDVEYGFELDNSVTKAKIELTTSRLFKNCNINRPSFSYYKLGKNEINSETICLAFSVNVVLSEDLKKNLKI
jgi:hypothetical protein